MSVCHLLRPSRDNRPQDGRDSSFLGGVPSLPISEAIPRCALCAAEQTFFFQVALPDDQVWPRSSVATFACTSCANENYLIPEMLAGRLRAGEIPEGFLTAYQRNFRFLVCETDEATLRREYVEKVRFHRLEVVTSGDPSAAGNKIGGVPNWLLEDETPSTYACKVPMSFLLQLEPGLRFETVEGAPRQIELGLDGKPGPASRLHYELFIGNALYLFGTNDPELRLVYAITQID